MTFRAGAGQGPPWAVRGATLRALAPIVCIALLAGAAAAHTRSISYSSWSLDEQGGVVHARMALLDLSRLAFDPRLDTGSGGRAARYVADHLQLFRGDAPCAVEETPVAVSAPQGWVRYRWRLLCSASGSPVIESRVLLDVAPSHMQFARVEGTGGVLERVLTE